MLSHPLPRPKRLRPAFVTFYYRNRLSPPPMFSEHQNFEKSGLRF